MTNTPPPPLSPTLAQLPRLVGVVTLAVSIGLALTAPGAGQLDVESPWWSVWMSTAAIGLATSPLTMLLLWRNGRRVPILGDDGAPLTDERGRPRVRRVELRGSRVLLQGLALGSVALLVLMGTLLITVGLGN